MSVLILPPMPLCYLFPILFALIAASNWPSAAPSSVPMDPEDEAAADCVRSVVARSSRHDRDMYKLDPSLASDRLRQEPCIKQLLEANWTTRMVKDWPQSGSKKVDWARLNDCKDCRSNGPQDIVGNLIRCLSLRNEECCSCLFHIRLPFNYRIPVAPSPSLKENHSNQNSNNNNNGSSSSIDIISQPIPVVPIMGHNESFADAAFLLKPQSISKDPVIVNNFIVGLGSSSTEAASLSRIFELGSGEVLKSQPVTSTTNQKPADIALADIQRRIQMAAYAPRTVYTDPKTFHEKPAAAAENRLYKQKIRSTPSKNIEDIQKILENPVAWLNKFSNTKNVIGLGHQQGSSKNLTSNKLTLPGIATGATSSQLSGGAQATDSLMSPFPNAHNIALAAENILKLLDTDVFQCENKTKVKDCFLHFRPTNSTLDQGVDYFKRLENRLKTCQEQLEFCATQLNATTVTKPAMVSKAVRNVTNNNNNGNKKQQATTELQGQVYVAGVPVGFALHVPADPVDSSGKGDSIGDNMIYNQVPPVQRGPGQQIPGFYMPPGGNMPFGAPVDENPSLNSRDTMVPYMSAQGGDDMKSRVFQNFLVQVPLDPGYPMEMPDTQDGFQKPELMYPEAMAQKMLCDGELPPSNLMVDITTPKNTPTTKDKASTKDPLLNMAFPELPIMAGQSNQEPLTNETVEDLFKKIDEFKDEAKKTLMLESTTAGPATSSTTPTTSKPTTTIPATMTTTTTTTTTTSTTQPPSTPKAPSSIPMRAPGLTSAELAMQLLEDLDKKLANSSDTNRTELLKIYETLKAIRIRVAANVSKSPEPVTARPTTKLAEFVRRTTQRYRTVPIDQADEDYVEPTRIVTVIEYVTDEPEEEVRPNDIEQMAKEAADERFFTKKADYFEGLNNEPFNGYRPGVMEGDRPGIFNQHAGQRRKEGESEMLNEVVRIPYDKSMESNLGKSNSMASKNIIKANPYAPRIPKDEYIPEDSAPAQPPPPPQPRPSYHESYPIPRNQVDPSTGNQQPPEPNKAMFKLAKAYRDYASKLQPRVPPASASAPHHMQRKQQQQPSFKGAVEQKDGVEKHYADEGYDIPMYHQAGRKHSSRPSSSKLEASKFRQGANQQQMQGQQEQVQGPIAQQQKPGAQPPPSYIQPSPSRDVEDSLAYKPRGSRASKEAPTEGYLNPAVGRDEVGQEFGVEAPPDYYVVSGPAGAYETNEAYPEGMMAVYDANPMLYDSNYVPDLDLGNSIRVRRSKKSSHQPRSNGMANKLKKKLEEEAKQMMETLRRKRDTQEDTTTTSTTPQPQTTLKSTLEPSSSNKTKVRTRKHFHETIKKLSAKLPTVWIFKDKNGKKIEGNETLKEGNVSVSLMDDLGHTTEHNTEIPATSSISNTTLVSNISTDVANSTEASNTTSSTLSSVAASGSSTSQEITTSVMKETNNGTSAVEDHTEVSFTVPPEDFNSTMASSTLNSTVPTSSGSSTMATDLTKDSTLSTTSFLPGSD